mgnify:CR=1 FL=1
MHLSDERGPVYHHLGVSGFATHAVVDRRSVVPVDADVPADVAAVLGCAVLTGGGAVLNAASTAPGESPCTHSDCTSPVSSSSVAMPRSRSMSITRGSCAAFTPWPMRDAHLQPGVKLWADKIRAQQKEIVEPLIRRWLPNAEQYGNV